MVFAFVFSFLEFLLNQLDAENYYSREFSVIFLSLSAVGAAAPMVPLLQYLVCHGKRVPLITDQQRDKDAKAGNFTIFSVPKSLFVHMYAVGILIGAVCLSRAAIIAEEKQRSSVSNVYLSSVSIQGTLMFEIHCMRRFLECIYITAYGSSSMNLAVYLFGIFHYLVTPSCIFYSLLHHDHQNSNDQNTALRILLRLFSLLLYTIGNISQFRCHQILFNMKRSGKVSLSIDSTDRKSNGVATCSPQESRLKFGGSDDKSKSATTNADCAPIDPLNVDHVVKSKYSFPVGFGFDSVACPHYMAEILIYISFCMLSPSSLPLLSMLAWVVTNLSVVADSQFEWYKKNFPKEMNLKKGWKRLIPGVW
jgi:3-oxo-5-alpha-steroid 4-dehydrogenase